MKWFWKIFCDHLNPLNLTEMDTNEMGQKKKTTEKLSMEKIFLAGFSPLLVSSSMDDQVSETKRLKKLHDALMLIIASGHTTFIFWLIQQQILIKRKYWLDLFNNQLQLCWALSPVFYLIFINSFLLVLSLNCSSNNKVKSVQLLLSFGFWLAILFFFFFFFFFFYFQVFELRVFHFHLARVQIEIKRDDLFHYDRSIRVQ